MITPKMRDLTPLTDEQSKLVEEHLYLVKKHAKKYDKKDQGVYDAALDGLIKAARRFRPHSGATFATYTSQRIAGSVIDYFRLRSGVKCGRLRQRITPIMQPWASSNQPPSTVESPLTLIMFEDERHHFIQTLPLKFRRVVERSMRGDSIEQIAAALGVSKNRVWQMKQELQQRIEDGEFFLAS